MSPFSGDMHHEQYRTRAPVAAQGAFVDAIIAQRLPGWLRGAEQRQLQALGEALTLCLYFRQRVNAMLAKIDNIDRFALPLLQQALASLTGPGVDVAALRFRKGRREPVINTQPLGAHLTTVVYEQVPALTVALRNFTLRKPSRAANRSATVWKRRLPAGWHCPRRRYSPLHAAGSISANTINAIWLRCWKPRRARRPR